MRRWLPIVALIGVFVPDSSSAQAPAGGQAAPAAPRLFAAAGDVTAMIERARSFTFRGQSRSHFGAARLTVADVATISLS
jgi:hypothetical protein